MATALQDFTTLATDVMQLRYSHDIHGRKESWEQIASRVSRHVLGSTLPHDTFSAVYEAIRDRKFIPGGRILAQSGRMHHQTDNCFCLKAEDSREGWADLAHKTTMMFMSGGGVGVDYSAIRPYGTALKRSGGIGSGPCSLIKMIDGIAEGVRQGGERRGACYASLHWSHADIDTFLHLKDNIGSLSHTNISVQFNPLHLQCSSPNSTIRKIFTATLHQACSTGDPGFQFDCDNQTLRNACTEIISADDSDSCCLGSVNLAQIQNLQELYTVTELGVLFLLCNTMYTHCPTEKVGVVKRENRRLGLGLMGVAEWFLQRGLGYGDITSDFPHWLQVWKEVSERAALGWSDFLSINQPIAVRAIAPTGTISIAGGLTTPGIEPIFCQAYKRTYNTLKEYEYSNGYTDCVVIDPIVCKLVSLGFDVRYIDTAYSLSQNTEGIERRIMFQAFCQQYVDNAISSTVNLPSYREGIVEKIEPILLQYCDRLRGITCYPDGRHGYQPVQPVPFSEACGQAFSVQESVSCINGVCGV